jgi:hypothetical protein
MPCEGFGLCPVGMERNGQVLNKICLLKCLLWNSCGRQTGDGSRVEAGRITKRPLS